jgi:hypothetical protein
MLEPDEPRKAQGYSTLRRHLPMAVFDLDLVMMGALAVCFLWCYVIVVRQMFQNGSSIAAIL